MKFCVAVQVLAAIRSPFPSLASLGLELTVCDEGDVCVDYMNFLIIFHYYSQLFYSTLGMPVVVLSPCLQKE